MPLFPFTFKLVMYGTISKAKYLEPTRISNNGSFSVNEVVESTGLLDNRRARLHHKMVSIAEHELQTNRIDHFAIHGFQGSIGAYSYKARRIDNTMRSMDSTHAGA